METAYDNNSENNVCEIETSHFKTFDTNHEYTSSEVTKDTFLEDEHKATSPKELLKSDINPDYASDDQTTSNLLETKHRFDDDFGPETDVDAVDDANITKSPNMLLEEDSFSSNVTNGVKGFSLENKIIEHLSGQHKEFLTNTNPFNEDQFDQYHDQYAMKDELMDQAAIEKSENDSEIVVDNKIIDALESLGITNGEKQTHDDEDKPLDSGLVNDSSAEVAGYTEKADQSYEKSFTETQHEHPFDINASVICDKQEMEEQTYGVNPNCAATSAGEESDEEDEWNYIQGDKKQDQPLEQTETLAPPVNEPVEDESFFHQDPVGSEFVAEEKSRDENIAELPSHLTPSDVFVADGGKLSETIDEPTDTEADLCGQEATFLLDPVSVETSPVTHPEQDSEYQVLERKELENPEQEHQEPVQIESCEYVPSPVPRSVLQSEVHEEASSQPDLFPLEQKPEALEQDAELLLVDQREGLGLSEASNVVDDHEVERPNSLSLDMASKLNPEAKEFVPTGSPTLSNPTSPVSSMPELPQNSFLMLGDDVVAQSPKKGVATTMDNIDVPAEDDFQLEMNNCPHELEQTPEHTNGTANGDDTNRSHSPVSEPSYQELNLKEAMQCDEKLDNEYNDVQQNNDTVDNHPNELNILGKDQNPMNMSFYEGRDEALIISNSDELNKVQPLPSDDESSEQNNVQSVDEMASRVEEGSNSVEDTPIQSEDQLVSFETHAESVNASPHAEQHPESIFTAAAQVVDDVTALVGQIEIEIPAAVDNVVHQEGNANLFELDEQFSKASVTEIVASAHKTENLVCFEQDLDFGIQPKEAVTDAIDLDVQLQPAELSQPLSAAETDELASPVVEVSQQEVTTDNEFITDENVLDVSSPIPPTAHEAPVSPAPVVQNEPEEELFVVEKEATVEQVPEVLAKEPAPADTITGDPVPAIVEEGVKPVTEEMPAQKTTTNDEPIVPKSIAPEQVVSLAVKTAKAPITGTAKKAPTTAKPLTKPAAKPAPAAKTTTVAAAKKTPATTGPAARTSTIGTKSPKVATTTRTSTTTGTTEKKAASSMEKKLVNGDAKTAIVQKKTVTSTTSLTAKSASATAATRTTTTTVKSVTAKPPASAKPAAPPAKAPASARAPTTARAPVSATPRPSSGPAKTGSVTARTSTGLPATKPRVAPAAASKSVGAASTTTVASRTVTATKRISSVQTTSQKTATTASSTTTAAAKSSSTTSRTSVAAKSSNTSTGLLRKTGTAPAKKPITSPSAKSGTKIAPAGGKPVPTKSNAVVSLKETTTVSNDTKDLLDLDKQLKNDNNQLITKNGIETQMIVIDSAAD